ncbi:hypothetical protein B0H14DRAFT_2577838 [Mycena olivaceomarginata]|nr:hypothetical protein B0H14DRAFT_2577838 [Mycena olivaceomarginata]
MSLCPPPLSPAEDKALKQEALRCIEDDQRPVPGELHIWLDFHGASVPAIPDRQHHQRVRAAIIACVSARAAARKAAAAAAALTIRDRQHHERVHAALIARVSTRAIEASAHKWPRPRCHPQHPNNQAYFLGQRREEEARIQKEKAHEHAENRAGSGCPSCAFGGTAVETLLFEDVSAHVDLEEWTRVLPQLVNLWCLGIAPNIPLPQQAIPRITFRLTCFQAVCSVAGAWRDFVASQSTLDEIYLDSFFWGDVPSPQQLPHLRSFKGHPQNLVNFAAVHSLVDIWVFTGVPLDTHVFAPSNLAKLAASPSRLSTIRISALDFLAVLKAAPALLTTLRHLVVDEDLSWSNFTLATGHDLSRSTFGRLAAALDGHFLHLKTVLLVCSPTYENREGRRPLYQSDAECFSTVFTSYCGARRLRAFRFYASDGCAFWYRWGQDTETVSYATRRMELHPETTSEWFHLSLTSSLVLQDAQQDQKKSVPFSALGTCSVECAEEELRPEPCAQDSTKATNSSHNSVTDAQWNNWVDQLMAAADEPDVEQPAGEETDKEQWAAEEEERERAWDRAECGSPTDLQRGECCVLPGAMFIASFLEYWRSLDQIHGDSTEAYWGCSIKTDGEISGLEVSCVCFGPWNSMLTVDLDFSMPDAMFIASFLANWRRSVKTDGEISEFELPFLRSCICFSPRNSMLTVDLDFSMLKTPGLLHLALTMLNTAKLTGDEDDDEIPPLIGDEIPNVRCCPGVRSKL